jgi:hypothetical protein
VTVEGSESGLHDTSVGVAGTVLELNTGAQQPRARSFFPGERVTVSVNSAAASADGLRMKAGFQSTFDVQTVAGSGVFQRREERGGVEMISSATADVDGDGRLDLVTTQEGTTAVVMYLNRSDGLLRTQQQLASALLDPGPLAIEDFDRDGRLDIAVLDRTLPKASILFNKSGAEFEPAAVVSLSSDGTLSRPIGMTVADWNGDGLADLAALNRLTDDVTVMFNDGGRKFQAPVRIAVGGKPVAISAGDLDGNGQPDLITVNTRPDTISLFINQGNGRFLKKEELPLLYGDPRQVFVRDFNRDGAIDVLIVDPASKELVRFQNVGDGSFRRPDYLGLPAVPARADVADVDGDGSLDVVVGHATSVTVLRGAPDGTFRNAGDGGLKSGVPFAGDFDGDGAIDMVLATAGEDGADALVLFTNTARRGLTSSRPPPLKR